MLVIFLFDIALCTMMSLAVHRYKAT